MDGFITPDVLEWELQSATGTTAPENTQHQNEALLWFGVLTLFVVGYWLWKRWRPMTYRAVVLTLFVASLATYFGRSWYLERQHWKEWRISSADMSMLKSGIGIDYQNLWDFGDLRHYKMMPQEKQQRFCEFVAKELGVANAEYFKTFLEVFDEQVTVEKPEWERASLRFIIKGACRIWKEDNGTAQPPQIPQASPSPASQ